MGSISNKLLNMLTGFLVNELGSLSIQGVTYALLLKNDKKDMERYKKYLEIKKETENCGYGFNEVFTVYEVSNGYVLDLDLNVSKLITKEITKAVIKLNKEDGIDISEDIAKDTPDKRRRGDVVRLAKHVADMYNKGNKVIEVALFNRNSIPRIIVTGRAVNGEVITVKYNAFAIRTLDIETLNRNLLIPNGLCISKIQSKEILPSKTGVSCLLHVERLE